MKKKISVISILERTFTNDLNVLLTSLSLFLSASVSHTHSVFHYPNIYANWSVASLARFVFVYIWHSKQTLIHAQTHTHVRIHCDNKKSSIWAGISFSVFVCLQNYDGSSIIRANKTAIVCHRLTVNLVQSIHFISCKILLMNISHLITSMRRIFWLFRSKLKLALCS